MSHLPNFHLMLLSEAITSPPSTNFAWFGCAWAFVLAYTLDLGFRGTSEKFPQAAVWLFRVTWLILSALLAYRGLILNDIPRNGAGEILLSIAWGFAGLSIFLDLVFDHRLPVWLVSILTAACIFMAEWMGIAPATIQHTGRPLIIIHVGTAILAYGILAAQALNAIAYLLQDRALAKRKFGGIYSILPSLVPMDKIGTQLMGAVVWILGLSLIIGGADWIQSSLNLIQLPKLIFALITWIGCLMLIIQRRRHQMSSARFARTSLFILLPALVALWLSLPTTPK
ncbi:MAG: cytochrome c biogenesis protein CcsA [Opitutae bacterium]